MEIGVAYYPEHWPEERWPVDARLMREAGIRRVRIGEFAWHRLEPREGRYEFGWLERAIAALGREGIGVIMCTPTPTYPAWLHRKHPDLHQVGSNGQIKEFGQRQDACKNHPGYRAQARRIAEAVARHFGELPAVVAWQTDNELGCHGTARCHCGYCEKEFQRWLDVRFGGSVERLNRAWGTVFWSQEYNGFSEVSVPRDTADQTFRGGGNPGLLLDFARFCSDVQVRFQREQVELIRRHSPGRPVTHNLMHYFYQIDYFELARDLDVVSWDNYPYFAAGTGRPPEPLPFALMHGLKRRPVWVMEQASGPAGWGSFGATPRPGQMRLWAYQAIARGADMVSFFRWRTCRFGREQFWHGILHHHGEPQWRYQELKELGRELAGLPAPLDATEPVAEIALLFDYASLWALEVSPQVAPGPGTPPVVTPPGSPEEGGGAGECPASYGYTEMAGQWTRILASLGVGVTVVSPEAELGGFRAVLAPTLHVVSPELCGKLERYVDGGGLLVLGPRSGVKDEASAVVGELLPGLLRRVAGVVVEDYDVFSARQGGRRAVRLRDGEGRESEGYALAEALLPEGGSLVLLSYAGELYAGKAAATEHAMGAGRCLYVGTVLGDRGLLALFQSHVPGCSGRRPLPEGGEIARRAGGGKLFAFYLNHGETSLVMPVDRPGTDLLSGAPVGPALTLPPYGVVIVAE